MAEAEKTTGTPTTDEVATTRKDIDIFSGWLTRLENPDPVLNTEAGGQGLKLYDQVARDAHAGSVLQTRYLAVAGRELEVIAADDSAAAEAAADLVREALSALNWTQAVSELLRGILYGFYVGEVMWTARNGKWVPGRIVTKHPRRFVFSMDRELRLLTPENMIDGEAVPDRKFIVFTFGSSDNPYGDGLGQKLWWPVWFKKNGIKFWLTFLEKFGQPTTVGKYPPGTPAAEQDALLDAIEAIQTETGVKIPTTMAIELLEAARTGKAEYGGMCEYMDRQISKAVLGQTATTEGTPGKLGNEQAQADVREDLIKADADLLCEALNAGLVRWIVDFNLAVGTPYPRAWIRTEPEADLKALAERDKTLVRDVGVRVPERYFRETYGLPEPEGDEPLVGGVRTNLLQEGPGGQFAEGEGEDATPIDEMAERMAEETAAGWEAVLKDVRRIVETADDLESLREALLSAYEGLPGRQLAEVMAAGFAAAELAGHYDANQESDG